MKGEKRLKNIILRIGIILLLFVMVFALTGCGSNNSQTSQEPQNEENTSQEGETVKLNDELEDVCGFAQQIEDGKYKIVALKEDGTIFDITNFGTTEYETLDYSGGKIYLQKEKDFYEIDLTKGNGNYELNKIFSYNLAKFTNFLLSLPLYSISQLPYHPIYIISFLFYHCAIYIITYYFTHFGIITHI